MATDTTNNSFDASAGIITIDWKLNTSDDIDSSDNDVTQCAENTLWKEYLMESIRPILMFMQSNRAYCN
jgi:hypothetical protein